MGLPPITYLLAALAAGLFALAIVSTQPADKIVGRLGAIGLIVAIMLPFGLVSAELRFMQMPLMTFLLVTVLVRRRSDGAVRPGLTLLLIGYVAVTFTSTYYEAITGAMLQLYVHAIFGLTFFTVGALAYPAERRVLIHTLFGLAVVQSVYAVIEVLFAPPVLYASAIEGQSDLEETLTISRLPSEVIPGLDRAQGTFGQPLLLAAFLTVALALTGRWTFKRSSTRAILSIIFFIGAAASGSRSALFIMGIIVAFSFGFSRLVLLRGAIAVAAVGLGAWFFDFFDSRIYERFTSSGSLTHRQDGLDAVPQLLRQPLEEVLIGNGWFSQETMFSRGLLQRDGFEAIDNQLISTLVTAGVFGVILIVSIMIVSWLIATPQLRPAVFAIFVMYVVFDVNELPASWSILTLVVGMVARRDADVTVQIKPEKQGDWRSFKRTAQNASASIA